MNRTQALQLLSSKSAKRRDEATMVLAPVRVDCRGGKCGRCHSCRNAKSVPVALQEGGERCES